MRSALFLHLCQICYHLVLFMRTTSELTPCLNAWHLQWYPFWRSSYYTKCPPLSIYILSNLYKNSKPPTHITTVSIRILYFWYSIVRISKTLRFICPILLLKEICDEQKFIRVDRQILIFFKIFLKCSFIFKGLLVQELHTFNPFL